GLGILSGYLKKQQALYWVMFVLTALDTLFQGAIPLMYKHIFDTVFVLHSKTVPIFLLSLLALGFVVFAGLNILGRYLAVKAGAHVIKDIRMR
ncbi:hypothetical protein, partial [Halomonas sp. ND22Bw]|uniref:hypothetical protein n=1 Tax=Halomonas sp. ND22Bw TaxID=2054178 RepID=UPI0015E656F5